MDSIAHDLMTHAYVALLLLLSIPHYAVKINADTSEGAFDYGDGPLGPDKWGSLHADWYACGNGTSQSPIALKKKDLVKLTNDNLLGFYYKSGPAQLLIREHDIEVAWLEEGGFVSWKGEEYKLDGLHLHIPSEHTINGFRYPLEVHIVHQGPNNKYLVVSLLYKYGKEDAFLANVMEEFPALIDSGRDDHHVGNVSIAEMKLGKQYYHYMGSLTTPPCTEDVTWIIMKKKRNVSKDQTNIILHAELGDNARPLQPLNGRVVYKYK